MNSDSGTRSPAAQVVRYEVADGIAWLQVDRPEAHNALNEAVIAQLDEGVRRALEDRQVRGLAVSAVGKTFVLGADLKFFVRGLLSGDLERLIRFTQAGHKLFNTIADSPKPVVARLHGIALGGGVELALACTRIVAAPAARLAFPETGLGIYPGLGGTQRTPRRIGVGLTKWLLYTGHTLSADEAFRIGLVDHVVPPGELDAQVRAVIEQDSLPIERPPLSAEHQALQERFATQPLEDLLKAAGNTGPLSRKAPLALRLVEQLVDRGTRLPLSSALQLELDHLREIFSTQDARVGLSTLGKKQPTFAGR